MFALDILASSRNYVPVREENQVVHKEEDSQYIVHGINVRSEDTPDEEPITIEKEKSTVQPTSLVSDEDQAIQDELNRMLLQETIAKSYEDYQSCRKEEG